MEEVTGGLGFMPLISIYVICILWIIQFYIGTFLVWS